MIARGATVYAPAPDGSFLAGITRPRVIRLLRQSDVAMVGCRPGLHEMLAAQEVFSTSNCGKMLPVHRIADQMYASAPITQRMQQRDHAFAREELFVTAAA